MSSLNPQITTVLVGNRTLREVTIYPLSLKDQGSMAKILSGVFQSVMAALSSLDVKPDELEEPGKLEDTGKLVDTIESVAKQLSNIDIAETIVGIIQDNLETILALVVDPHEKIVMEELTNEQFYSLVELIYVVNYEGTTKNFVALVKRARNMGPEEKKEPKKKASSSKRSSRASVAATTIG